MNHNGLAYSTLIQLLEDWADEHSGIVRSSDLFAKHAADIIFSELLCIPNDEIDNEG